MSPSLRDTSNIKTSFARRFQERLALINFLIDTQHWATFQKFNNTKCSPIMLDETRKYREKSKISPQIRIFPPPPGSYIPSSLWTLFLFFSMGFRWTYLLDHCPAKGSNQNPVVMAEVARFSLKNLLLFQGVHAGKNSNMVLEIFKGKTAPHNHRSLTREEMWFFSL